MAKLRKRNGIYQAIYYTRDGRREFKTTHCSDKRAAQIAADRFEREAQDPDTTAKNAATLGAALEHLIDHMEELVKAKRRAKGTLGMHRDKAGHIKRVFELDVRTGEIVPFKLSSLEPRHIDSYISQRRKEGAHENTISKELVTLRSTLKLARRRGDWAGDVGAMLPSRFAPEYQPRERFLSAEELIAMLAEMPPDHAARAAFSVATSANRGETFRAQREDIGENAVYIRGTKRTSRKRTVPLTAPWQRQLVAYAVTHAQGTDGKLFLYDGGFHSALLGACVNAGIPHCSSNDLRRTFCHWMRQAGVPRDLVAAAMGHGSTAMVDKVYGKLTADELAMLMTRATGGTHVAQTTVPPADLKDSLDSTTSRKSLKSGAEGRTRTDTQSPVTDFESVLKMLPTPREYKRNRDYKPFSGTHAAQRKATAEIIPIPRLLRRKGSTA